MNDPQILFADDTLVVIDKPSGMVVNASRTAKEQTVQGWFAKKYAIPVSETEFGQKQGIVHRLDKDTSGVMVLAKTVKSYDKLKAQFLERKVTKTYLALVHGRLNPPEGTISLPIDRHPVVKTKFAISGNLSRTAVTQWTTKQAWQEFSLLELHPLTGRTHQLRVHLHHLGHPVVSDPLYGFKKKLKQDLAFCPRLFLHAQSLEFSHPETSKVLRFEAEIPEDLQRVLEDLVH